MRPEIPTILMGLENRGILSSIASRNEEQSALAALKEFGVERHFVAPRINHNPKAENLRLIAQELNIGLDSLAFIDDSPFEREAVKFSCPSVMVLDARQYINVLDLDPFQPGVQTEESHQRANYYRAEAARAQAEQGFGGSRLDFLISCQMKLNLCDAQAADVERVVELAARTNQFNATAIRYGVEEIEQMIQTPQTRLIVAELSDRFGEYGNVGAMTLLLEPDAGMVESLMISCRAGGRGIAPALLILAMHITSRAGTRYLKAKFRETKKNRQLGMLYHMVGLIPSPDMVDDNLTTWVYDLAEDPIPEVPEWLTLTTPIEDLIP